MVVPWVRLNIYMSHAFETPPGDLQFKGIRPPVYNFWFGLRIYIPFNSYGHIKTVSLPGLENSTRPLVFTSASGCRASEYFDIF